MTRRFDTWEQMEACHAEERNAMLNKMAVKVYRAGLKASDILTSKPSIRSIAEITAQKHGISYADLIGPSRIRDFTKARFETYQKAHQAGFSMAQIGRALGNRDHTTVMHGIRRHEETVQ